jgi:hypothetical protein
MAVALQESLKEPEMETISALLLQVCLCLLTQSD